MTNGSAVNYEKQIPDLLAAMEGVQQTVDDQGLDPRLRHLVRLRASQINRCAYCVKMHTREARGDGETNDRLDRLVVWDQVGDFTEAEKAALAWTEALTRLDPGAELDTLRARLRTHFDDREIGLLTAAIAMINLWNRLGVSRH